MYGYYGDNSEFSMNNWWTGSYSCTTGNKNSAINEWKFISDFEYDLNWFIDIEGYFKPALEKERLDAEMKGYFEIDRVIYNPPATIVYWKDGSKTVVKCAPNEEFVEEEGLAYAFIRKIFDGNRSAFLKLVENAYRQPQLSE